jgi:hypothetical protein
MKSLFSVKDKIPADSDTKFSNISDLTELTVASGLRKIGYTRVIRLNKDGMVCDPHYVKDKVTEESLLRNKLKDFILIWSKDINDFIKELELGCSISSQTSLCLLD